MDKSVDKSVLKIETHRSGHFVFQLGLDRATLEPLRARVEEAYSYIASSPSILSLLFNLYSPRLAAVLYRKV